MIVSKPQPSLKSSKMVEAPENKKVSERDVWDLILRASAANARKNQLLSELSVKLSHQEWSGCSALDAAITRVSNQKVALLAEVSHLAPETILIAADPRRPGYLSVTYLPRPQFRFHVPESARSKFNE